MVHYREYLPSLELRLYVECLWILKGPKDLLFHRELIIPGGRAEMIFILNEPFLWHESAAPGKAGTKYKGGQLLGPRNRYYFLESMGEIEVVGARFRPGGLVFKR